MALNVHTIITILNIFLFQQIIMNVPNDYITIKEINSNQNQKLIAYLTGPDTGPKSISTTSNWEKKIISVSTNQMDVEFISDAHVEYKGFSTNIYFTPIPKCESWLDMKKKIFRSPNYPKTHNSKKCSWLITGEHENHITLNLIYLYVRLLYKIELLIWLILIHLIPKYRWKLMLVF